MENPCCGKKISDKSLIYTGLPCRSGAETTSGHGLPICSVHEHLMFQAHILIKLCEPECEVTLPLVDRLTQFTLGYSLLQIFCRIICLCDQQVSVEHVHHTIMAM